MIAFGLSNAQVFSNDRHAYESFDFHTRIMSHCIRVSVTDLKAIRLQLRNSSKRWKHRLTRKLGYAYLAKDQNPIHDR